MNKEQFYQVLVRPIVSEKSSLSGASNKLVFEVAVSAGKQQIKRAVEGLFGVRVLSVNTLNVKGKTKRFGRYSGVRKTVKKAYITLENAAEFDVFDAQVN